MKRLLKNKSGASKMIEMLIILPIAVFITLLSVYKLVGMIVTNQMNDFNRELTREAIVARNFDDSMDLIYGKMQERPDYKVAYIKIYYYPDMSDATLQNLNITFSTIENSNQSFEAMFQGEDGNNKFNAKQFELNNRSLYNALQTQWKMSNLLEIGLYNDLTQNIYSKVSKVSIMVNGERKEFSFMLTSVLRTSNTQVISCQE